MCSCGVVCQCPLSDTRNRAWMCFHVKSGWRVGDTCSKVLFLLSESFVSFIKTVFFYLFFYSVLLLINKLVFIVIINMCLVRWC